MNKSFRFRSSCPYTQTIHSIEKPCMRDKKTSPKLSSFLSYDKKFSCKKLHMPNCVNNSCMFLDLETTNAHMNENT